MYTQRGERLRGALAEPDITQGLGVRRVEHVLNRVGDVVQAKVVD
jgi:hypothetical protein